MKIPFGRLGIPVEHRDKLLPTAPARARLAIAKGMLPLPPEVLLSCAYVLMGHKERAIRKAAQSTLNSMDREQVMRSISVRTHPKILEFLIEARLEDQELMERVYSFALANDRTAHLIAQAARGDLVDVICRNQSRLLMTPTVFLYLKKNPEIGAAQIERVESFLRMQSCLPQELEQEEEVSAPSPKAAPVLKRVKVSDLTEMSIQAEVQAALMGLPSPFTNPLVAAKLEILVAEESAGPQDNSFSFSFQDEAEQFSNAMVTDEDLAPEEKLSVGQQIASMTTGAKIKLAFLGNAEARKILIRDKNKQVAAAVVKSGRISDSEAAAIAANKNIHQDVLREIAINKEFLRSYKVKIGLVNNPKCPVSVAVGIVAHLQRADLSSLARNKGVSSVVRRTAKKTIQNRLDNKG